MVENPGRFGCVELLSSEFAIGWAEIQTGQETWLYATLDGLVIGVAAANLKRPDLEIAASEGRMNAAGFAIVFRHPVPYDRVSDIEVLLLSFRLRLKRASAMRLDRDPRMRIFIFGSPRSGTSELGHTLAKQLSLPWLGEGHAAPYFSAGATALSGKKQGPSGLVRYMANQNLREIAVEAAKRAYFFMHGSSSFIDKTPGVDMIKSASFLFECFPDAKFIYLRRNGISNVLSRMVKFGGDFDRHCADWAAALNEWLRIREALPHYLELEQESMADQPLVLGRRLAEYLEVPEAADAIGQSLRFGSLETTGAGREKRLLSEVTWTEQQIKRFKQLCGPTMEKFGYPLE